MASVTSPTAHVADAEYRVSFGPGTDRALAVAHAIAILKRDGVVVLDDLVDPAHIARCREQIEASYPHMAAVDRERNFGFYSGRHTVPMRIEGAIADRAVFVPEAVEEIAEALVGQQFKVDSYGLLVSVPGAEDQKPHTDASLFPEAPLEHILPAFALAFALPLVPLDAVSGTTAFWRRSHRNPKVADDHDLAPVIQPGSAVIWDFKTLHCGLANRGERPRPVIFTVLSRIWWVEIDQPGGKYEKLRITRAAYDGMSETMRKRLSRARVIETPCETEN